MNAIVAQWRFGCCQLCQTGDYASVRFFFAKIGGLSSSRMNLGSAKKLGD
jgi:hypothetical protein